KRSGVFEETKASFLDTKDRIPSDYSGTRREALAGFIVKHDQFPKALVNRMWAHFFGRGLNEQATPDDFGDHNKLVHPELLDKLAKDFATYGRYDLKQLITWICNSRPYQLSCVANDTNGKPEHEVFFSRMLLKNMSPEQLFGSLSVALYP